MIENNLANTERLTEEQSRLLLCLLRDECDSEYDFSDNFPAKVVLKRIEYYKLPIKFTTEALLALPLFCDNTGKIVLFLIECLEKFEHKTVTLKDICTTMYPLGFYTQEYFEWILDNEIKTFKYAHLY